MDQHDRDQIIAQLENLFGKGTARWDRNGGVIVTCCPYPGLTAEQAKGIERSEYPPAEGGAG